MSHFKFSSRELKFLELFFSGRSMKGAARGAGYRGSTDQSLCNTARKILTKYEESASTKGMFRESRATEVRIASLLLDMAMNSQPASKQLKGWRILSKVMFSKG
jgi:hypothetical protein